MIDALIDLAAKDAEIAALRTECVVNQPYCYKVITSSAHSRGEGLYLGEVVRKYDGWRFIPAYQANPSRRGWATPELALKGRVKCFYLVERKRNA